MPVIDDEINKQNLKTDKALTTVFNRLSKNLKVSADAVITNDGVLVQNVGTPNSFGNYLKTAGLKTTYVPTLTTKQIEDNEAFKTYKRSLKKEGYNVEITKTKGSHEIFNWNSGMSKGTKACMVVGLATLNPLWMIVGVAAGISGAAAIDAPLACTQSAEVTLKIKKIEEAQAPLLLEDKTKVQAETADLMTDLNQQTVKAAAKQPIIK